MKTPNGQHPQRQFHFEAWKPGNPQEIQGSRVGKPGKSRFPGETIQVHRPQQRNSSVHGALCCFSRPRRPGWCTWSRSWAATSAGPNAGRCTASWMQLSTKEKWRIPNEMFEWIQIVCCWRMPLGVGWWLLSGHWIWENYLQSLKASCR